jgi:hypothetical protein
MVRRTTWFALLVLAALIGLTIYLRQKPPGASAEVTETPGAPESQSLFGSEAGLPTNLKISAATGGTVELAHAVDNTWTLKQPIQAAADQGQAEAAATQIGALRALDPVELPLNVVGLDKPAYTIVVGFTGGVTHTLEIGDQTPSGSGYYTRMDKGVVTIVTGAGIDSLLGLLTAPPYLETPTPSPVPPTETPVPTQGTPGASETAVTPAP